MRIPKVLDFCRAGVNLCYIIHDTEETGQVTDTEMAQPTTRTQRQSMETWPTWMQLMWLAPILVSHPSQAESDKFGCSLPWRVCSAYAGAHWRATPESATTSCGELIQKRPPFKPQWDSSGKGIYHGNVVETDTLRYADKVLYVCMHTDQRWTPSERTEHILTVRWWIPW